MVSEMLGNQYFLARKYTKAANNFQQALANNSANKAIKKKLIICYTQTGEIEKALMIFHELVEEDIDFIINTDIKEDACPCNELIEKYGSVLPYEENSTDLKIMLGMLWLYCDPEKSLSFFKSVTEDYEENKTIDSIIRMIENSVSSKQHNKISNSIYRRSDI
jgi:pentatricopeptide repeat protein